MTGIPGGSVAQAVVAVLLAVCITSIASWLFHGRVGMDFVVTGAVAALIVNGLIDVVTRRLQEANRALERSVMARTAELQAARAAGGVAHEVKNPLSAVIGNLEMIEELVEGGELEGPELRKSAQSALLAARHLQSIVDDFRPLVDTAVEPAEPADLGDAARAAVRIAQPKVQEVGRVDVQLAELPPVACARSRVIQIVLNLVLNAVHATRPGSENVVRLTAGVEGPFVHLSVADQGIGMSPEVLARACEPGFTTRAGRGGTGLGLPIVRSIVEASRGRLEIHSTPDVGTIVHLWLPIA
ncbi:MAG: HAMP domain-containing sensor histidine kinase [Myxococcota bacterium]